MMSQRRYDIDWLRVIAIGLLLIYHIAIGFQPWGGLFRFLQNNESLDWIWIPMSMLNVWRIPLLFFVSGMGVYFAFRNRSLKALMIERTQRILIPFLFGMVAIVPLHVLIWQQYYHQDLSYQPDQAHLWFLGNIFCYVSIFAPFFLLMKKNENGRFQQVLSGLFKSPLGLLVILLLFVAEAVIIQPKPFEMYATTLHGFVLGMVAFVAGFLCVCSGEPFWQTVSKWKWALLGLAASLYAYRLVEFDLVAPNYLMAAESGLWIFTMLGFGHQYLNKPSNMLTYLSKAAYPVYIVHMVFQYAGSYLLFGLEMSAFAKFLLLNAFTLGGSLFFYDFVIRRIKPLWQLFGLKGKSVTKVGKREALVEA